MHLNPKSISSTSRLTIVFYGLSYLFLIFLIVLVFWQMVVSYILLWILEMRLVLKDTIGFPF